MIRFKELKESGHQQLDMNDTLEKNSSIIAKKISFKFGGRYKSPRSTFDSHVVLSVQTYNDEISTGEVLHNLSEFRFAWYANVDLNKYHYVQSFWIVPADEVSKYVYGISVD